MNFKKIISIFGVTMLLISSLPSIAKADIVENITISKIKPDSETIGATEGDGIKVETKVNLIDGQNYRVSLFDVITDKFIASCPQYEEISVCEFVFNDTSEFTKGEHHFQAILEQTPDIFENDLTSMSETINIKNVSNIIVWEKAELNLTLSTKSPVIDAYGDDVEGVYPSVDLNVSETTMYPEKQYYLVNLTTNKILNSVDASYHGMIENWGVDYEEGVNPNMYQVVLADADSNNPPFGVTDIEAITNVIAVSNTITQTPKPWRTEHLCISDTTEEKCGKKTNLYPEMAVITANITQGANRDKILYLAQGDKIIANYGDDLLHWYAIEGGPDISKFSPYYSEAIIADDYKGSKPTKVSQLKGIVKENILPSLGLEVPFEIAGGSNPSAKCTSECHGDPINSATGEFFDSKTDLSMATVGLPLSAIRNYSTQLKDQKSAMGYGWRNSYEMNLFSDIETKDFNLNSKTIYFEQENGSRVMFNKRKNGIYYQSGNSRLTMDTSDNNIIITRNESDKFHFDKITGKLNKIEDIYGNTINLTYLNGKLTNIKDSRNNYLNLTYTGTLITKIESNTGRNVKYTYSSNRLTNIVNENNVSTSYSYDGQRRIKTITDALGGITTNTYDSDSKVTKQVDPIGNILKFNYDFSNLSGTTKITNPDNTTIHEYYSKGILTKKVLNQGKAFAKEWTYSYDSYGNVISEVYPDKTFSTFIHDENGYLKESINNQNVKTKFTHDSKGLLLKITDALGKSITNDYDTKGNITSTTDDMGEKIVFEWNTDGTLKKTISPKGNKLNANPLEYTDANTYNAKGNLISTTNRENGVTKYSNDIYGRVTKITTPLGGVSNNQEDIYSIKKEYNNLDLPNKLTDQLGRESLIEYDNAGNIVKSTDPLGNIITFEYNKLGLETKRTNIEGSIHTVYDSMNRVIETTNKLGHKIVNTYDASGNLIRIKDYRGKITEYSYDISGNMIMTKDPMNNITRFVYNKAGQIISSIDAMGNASYTHYDVLGRMIGEIDKENRYTAYSYDDNDQIIKIVMPDGSTKKLSYDEHGNMITRTNGMNHKESWSYDNMDRMISYTNQENQTINYEYDENSQTKTISQTDGNLIKNEYLTNGLISKVDYYGTNDDISYSYDALNRVTEQTKGTQPTIFTSYDISGRIIQNGSVNKEIKYEYTELGETSKITYPSGRVSNYTYDESSNITQVNIASIGNINYTYDDNNNQITTMLPNGVSEKTDYDALKRTTTIDIKKNSQSMHKVEREYSVTNNVKSSSINNVKENTYTHDSLDRITNTLNDSTETNSANQYNSANHLTTLTNENISSNKTGRPNNIGLKSMSYDTRGNRIKEKINDTTKELEWSQNNSLTKITTPNTTINYEYDANGLISKRTENNQNKNFIWDNNTPNALMISDGDYEYLYGNSRIPIAQININTNEIKYLHSDFIGSVIVTTTDTGNLDETMKYGAYGKRIGANVTRYGFAGEWADPSSDYSYNRARWYDPETAHFLSLDPLVQLTEEAYGYAGGSPLRRIDPSGFGFIEDSLKFARESLLNAGLLFTGIGDGGTDQITTSLRKTYDFDLDKKHTCGLPYQIGESIGRVLGNILPIGKLAKSATSLPSLLDEADAKKASKDSAKKYFDSSEHASLKGLEKRTDASKNGVVYLRYDKHGLIADYVGQTNRERYFTRQNEHGNNFPDSDFGFVMLGNANPNSKGVNPKTRDLSMMEEDYIRLLGGPQSRNGILSNTRVEMSQERYEKYGGQVPAPW